MNGRDQAMATFDESRGGKDGVRAPAKRLLFPGQFCGMCSPFGIAVLLAVCSLRVQAATVPFTFSVTYDVLLQAFPSPGNMTVPGGTQGSGTFVPFGNAIYSEMGTATFGTLPNGDLFPDTVRQNFAASFNNGADTITGTDVHLHDASGALVSETWSILGGTGVFQGASGSAAVVTDAAPPSGNTAPGYAGTLTTTGSGQVTAPGLNAVPEPATMPLAGLCLAGMAVLGTMRKKGAKVHRRER